MASKSLPGLPPVKQSKPKPPKEDDEDEKAPGLNYGPSSVSTATQAGVDNSQRKPRGSVKVKLTVGTEVEIYSNSAQRWSDGKIIRIKGDLLCIQYGNAMKWVKKDMKIFRLKQHQIERIKTKSTAVQADGTKSWFEDLVVALESSDSEGSDEDCSDHEDAMDGFSSQRSDHVLRQSSVTETDNKSDFKPPPPPGPPPPPPPKDIHYEDALKMLAVSQFRLTPDPDDKLGTEAAAIARVSSLHGLNTHLPVKPTKTKTKKKRKKQHQHPRGTLRISIQAAQHLKKAGSYCVIQIGVARLTSHKVNNNENPQWNEIMTFENYRPDKKKGAIAEVWQQHPLEKMGAKDKLVGKCTFDLPMMAGKTTPLGIELRRPESGKIAGYLELATSLTW